MSLCCYMSNMHACITKCIFKYFSIITSSVITIFMLKSSIALMYLHNMYVYTTTTKTTLYFCQVLRYTRIIHSIRIGKATYRQNYIFHIPANYVTCGRLYKIISYIYIMLKVACIFYLKHSQTECYLNVDM